MTVLSEERIKGPETCEHTLHFTASRTVPVTFEEKVTWEKIGVVTKENIP